MKHTLKTLWRRVQEEPLELAIALTGVAIAAANIIGRLEEMTAFAVLFYAVLLIGGGLATVGRLRDSLQVESIGLTLMVGGWAFSTLRRLGRATDGVDVSIALIAGGAIALGLFVRTLVVRKALAARIGAGRRLRR